MRDVTCAGCDVVFQAAGHNAKWHDTACKKRAQRAAAKAGKLVEPTERVTETACEPRDVERHGLVRTTYRELEAAGKLDTFDGQLALQLARRLANPDESGVSSLSKELRTVMAAAIGSPGGAADTTPVEPDDEVTRARKARDEARQAAGLA